MNDKIIKNICVYGGQYGSEGKASACEFWINKLKEGNKVVAIGENSPNSGHTCSLGSTTNIPASSFFSDFVLLGPDSVIDKDAIEDDILKIGDKPIFVHENASFLTEDDKINEKDLILRISSTGSGSGKARQRKFIERNINSIIKNNPIKGLHILNHEEYFNLINFFEKNNFLMIFECSQGSLLDINFGIFPYCTSRSTLPRVAIERNGLGHINWKYAGVYRTYPIRTGGNSGVTDGDELSWENLGLKPEITTVTKRVRRIFEFSSKDFKRSIKLNRPNFVMFTFLDYIGINNINNDCDKFIKWAINNDMSSVLNDKTFMSNKTGEFFNFK